jgi:putative ABC transport system permease protein
MKSYLKFLSRNKLYTAIEFIGLAVSLAFVILIGSYVLQQRKAAQGYPEWKNTYLVGTTYGSVEMGPRTGLAGLLKENVPEIEKASAYSYLGIQGKVGEVSLHEAMIAGVNADFLDMFPIRWVAGNPDALLESNTVAMKERFAREMFPGEDVIGKVWAYDEQTYTVVAIFQDLGSPIFRDDELVLLQVKENGELTRGYTGGCTCIVRSDEPEEKLMADIDAVLESHHRIEWGRDESRAMKNGSIERMDRLYFSDLIHGDQVFLKGNQSLLKMLSAVVLLLLLSAIFNYINLSSALAGRRVKEMGMRTVLGASREQIVWGFLKESLVFTAACTVMAVLLAYAFRPVFTHYVDAHVSHSPISVPFAWHWDFGTVALVIGLSLLIGLVAGWIPSRIASRFDAIRVIKGDYRTASKRILSKIFIVFQTGLSVLLIAFSLVMERQYSHMIHRPLGANVDGLYYQHLVQGTGHEDALKALPFVSEMDQANGFPGQPYMTMSMQDKETGGTVSCAFLYCGPEAFRMYGFEVVEDFHAPNREGYWLSESAFRRFGTDPAEPRMPAILGEWFQGTVAGVVKDFAMTDAAHVNDDLLGILSVNSDLNSHFRVLRIDGNRKEAEKELQALYKRFSMERDGYEGIPGLSGYIKNQLDARLGAAENYMRLIELFMFLAVMVALLGLLAMSALYASERTHDIAVRKVFGSTVEGETLKSVGLYMVLVGISCVIAVPVAVWLAGKYLEDFHYRISGYGWIFAVAVLVTLAMSFLAVLWQNLKAARTNPATELKKE